MFDSLKINNFRGLSDLSAKPLKKINIFVGDNCTGKTSILDAIFISINPNNPNLIATTNFFRNIIGINREYLSSYYYNLNIAKDILIELSNGKKNRGIRIKPVISKTGILSNRDANLLKVSEQKSMDYTGIENEVTGLLITFNVDEAEYQSKIILYPEMPPRVEFDEKFVSDLNGRYLNHGTFNNVNIAAIFSTIIQEKKKKQVIDFLRNFKSTIEDINLLRITLY
jgi:AAA15 family ATPase/GTPase